jgi:hypothetical protein
MLDSNGCKCHSCKCTTSNMRLVFSFSVWILASNWVIQMVLKVDMAMVAIEMPMSIKHFGQPGVEIFDFCGRALIICQKSSRELLIMARLTSVTNLVINLKASSCWSSNLS